uniref:Uncharacterized protein n=1 Tax=Panagrolaimus sp. ES5 TaxID=591445 RepID=A0AC34G0C8_9BILA
VSRFIDTMSGKGIQFIFISHRLELYAYANRLIGSSIHCKNACNYGSIIFTVDVRDYLGEIGQQQQYDPDDEVELEKKKESNEEFSKAVEIKNDEAPLNQGIMNAEVSRFIDTMSGKGIQFIFISHRLELYAYANRLIGSSIHCKNACNYGSIIFTVDVRDYLGEIGQQQQYDPDDEVELEKKKEANEEFSKAVEIKNDEAPLNQGVMNAEVENLMEMYATQDVKEFLNGIDSEDAFEKCPNNSDVQDLKELFARMTFGNF